MAKRMILAFVLATMTAVGALAANVVCPIHNEACYNTGKDKPAADGVMLHLYHCKCGDEYWVRD